MKRRKETGRNPEREEGRKKGGLMDAMDLTLVLFMAVMLGLCVAMPYFFGYMAPYAAGLSRIIPLESRYLGPGLFVLVHLAMIPLFFGKSKD